MSVRWLPLILAALAACGRARPTPVPAPAPPTVAQAVRAVLEQALADSAFPGAYAIVGTTHEDLASVGVGRIDWPADSPAPTANTLWDLASLTKVVGLTSAVLQLVGERRIDLDAPVQRYLPQFTGAGKEWVTVRHLLTHSSGLPSWRPLHKEAVGADSALLLALATPLDRAPGDSMVYSDLGAITLGRLVERVSGQSLDVYLATRVFGPAGMYETMYRPPDSLRSRIAPTEYDPWRQRKVHGEVHDENARALGGVSGHAGLFSTAADMARFARLYLRGGVAGGVIILPPAQIAEFTRVQNATQSHRALGWETPTGTNSAGDLLSPGSFGHTGFTGTSIWMDPRRGMFVILLSNRVNPTRENRRIGEVRTRLAHAAAAAFDARTAAGLGAR